MSRTSHSVWIVDDEPGLAATVSELLGAYGFVARGFTDPRELLDECLKGPSPDVVVTDFRMPHLAGSGLAAKLQDGLGAEAPPIVCVTGYPPDVSDEMRERFYAVIEKPFRLDDLALVIEQALGRAVSRLRMRAVLEDDPRLRESG